MYNYNFKFLYLHYSICNDSVIIGHVMRKALSYTYTLCTVEYVHILLSL